MKTGYTCAAGWNLVATAFRGGRRLVVVVLGAPTAELRNGMVVDLLDRGFDGIDRPRGSIRALPTSAGAPPDLHDKVCAKDGPETADFAAQVAQLDAPLAPASAPAPLTSIDSALAAPATPQVTGVVARIAALPDAGLHAGAGTRRRRPRLPGRRGAAARAARAARHDDEADDRRAGREEEARQAARDGRRPQEGRPARCRGQGEET